MTTSINNIATHKFTSSDNLFLDTNIWLSIFGPYVATNSNRVSVYSSLLSKTINASCKIFTDVLIISEFINVCARFHWHASGSSKTMGYKQYRNNTAFNSVATGIAADANRILARCRRVNSGFDSLPIGALITEFAKGNSDFNDQVLKELCKSEGFTLVTHDGDFDGQGISILTANKKLLKTKRTS